MAKLISKRYAIALFELAKEKNNLEQLNTEISFILDSINNNPEFFTIFTHPQISGGEKFQLFKNIFTDNVSEDIIALVSIVINKNRESEIKNIFNEFISLFEEHKGIKTAYVYSAKELSEAQINSIKEKLSQNLNKEIIIKTEIQPDLIGGIKINVGGFLIDNSIKKQLKDIKNSFNNN